LLVHEMLDQAVGRLLPWHVLGAHHVGELLVHLAERRRGGDVVGAQRGDLVARMGEVALVQNLAHLNLRNSLLPAPLSPSSCPALGRASTPCVPCGKDVDGRDKPGHDGSYRSFGGRKSSWPGLASLGG